MNGTQLLGRLELDGGSARPVRYNPRRIVWGFLLMLRLPILPRK